MRTIRAALAVVFLILGGQAAAFAQTPVTAPKYVPSPPRPHTLIIVTKALENGLPIPGAAVRNVMTDNIQGTTDAQGRWAVTLPPPWVFWFRVEASGRFSAMAHGTAVNMTDTVTFALNSEANPTFPTNSAGAKAQRSFVTGTMALPAAGTCIVTGTVTESKSGAPANAVLIRVQGTTLGTTTDQYGHYRLSAAPGTYRPGQQYQIVATRQGLASAMRVQQLKPGVVAQNFVLAPDVNRLGPVSKSKSNATPAKR